MTRALALALCALAACRRSPPPSPPRPETPDVVVATPESAFTPYRVDPSSVARAGAVRGG